MFFKIALFSIPLYIFLAVYSSKIIHNVNKDSKIFSDKNKSNYIQLFSLTDNIKIFNIFNMVNANIQKNFNTMYHFVLKEFKILYIFYIIEICISFAVQCTFFLVGIFSVVDNKMTIGEFSIAFIFYQSILSSVSSILQFLKKYQACKVSFSRMDKIVSKNDSVTDEFFDVGTIDSIYVKKGLKKTLSEETSITYDNMIFNINTIYNIVGKNGTGKTTLLNLMATLQDYDESGIYVNNHEMTSINLTEYRNKMTYIMQDFIFLNDESVLYNLNFFLKLNKSTKQMFNLLKKEGLIDLFNSIADIETFFDEKINKLSGGTKKKLALCIAILKNAIILLLDEPFNELDSQSIEIFLKILEKHKNERIIIIVDHSSNLDNINHKTYSLNNNLIQEGSCSEDKIII